MSGTLGSLGSLGGGGGIDASIPLKAGQGVPQPENPMTTLGKFGQVQNILNQNALFPIQKQTAETELNQKNLGYAMATHQALLGLIGSHLTDSDEPIDPKSIISGTVAMVDALNAAYPDRPPITAAQMTKGLALVPMPPPGTDFRDPKYQPVLVDRLKQINANTLSAAQSIAMRMGQAHQINVGGEVVPGVVGGMLGSRGGAFTRAGAPVGLGLTPDEASELVTTTGSNNQPVTGPRAGVVDPSIVPRSMGGTGGNAAQPPPSRVPGAMGTGRYPGSGGNRDVSSTDLPTRPGAGGTTFEGPAAGQLAAQAKDVEAFKGEQQGIPARETAVQSLDKALKAINLTNTGRGAEALNKMKSFIQSMTPAEMNAAGIDPFKVSTMNYDLAHKYLIDYARSQGSAGGTNLQLQTSQESNASTGISNAAAIDVIKTNIGRERQKIAQVLGAPDPNGIGYGKHAADFAGATDPRAFAFDMYSPAERKKILADVDKSKTSRDKFERSLALAVRLKLVTPDRDQPNAQ